jgi:transcriptional antiterminator Rof (Rho-off)
MDISFFPSKNFKILKYLDELPEDLSENLQEQFALYERDEIKLFSVFVNGEQLSYHNFENIVSLDRLGTQFQFELSDLVQPNKNLEFFVLQLNGTTERLLQLDSLNMYSEPLNSSKRGGKRFIFQSSKLSAALTSAINGSKSLGRNWMIKMQYFFIV